MQDYCVQAKHKLRKKLTNIIPTKLRLKQFHYLPYASPAKKLSKIIRRMRGVEI